MQAQGVKVKPVPRRDLRQVIATNLRYFMGLENCPYKTPNSLAVAAKVAPNTVYNLLDATRRTTTARKPNGYPTLDKLEDIAAVLGCEAWELMHPDLPRSLREREMYKTIESDFQLRSRVNGDLAKTLPAPIVHRNKRDKEGVKQ